MDDFKTFQGFIDMAFYALLCGGLGLIVTTLRSLSASAQMLNEKLAIVLERLATHDVRIGKLESRENECLNYKSRGER